MSVSHHRNAHDSVCKISSNFNHTYYVKIILNALLTFRCEASTLAVDEAVMVTNYLNRLTPFHRIILLFNAIRSVH